MKKFQRILAMAAVVLIALFVILTLVFALLTYFRVGDFSNIWRACMWCAVIAPLFIYGIIIVSRMFNKE